MAEPYYPTPEELGMPQPKFPTPEEVGMATPKFPTPEEVGMTSRGKMNVKKREFDVKRRGQEKFFKNIFGPKGLLRMYQYGSPETQERIREIGEEKPSAFMTPPHAPRKGRVEFQPGGRVEYKPLTIEPPPPEKVEEFRRLAKQKEPPKVGRGDIFPGTPTLKKAEEPVRFMGEDLPVGGPVVRHVLEPTYEILDSLIFRNVGGAVRGLQEGLRDISEGKSVGAAGEKALEMWAKSIRGLKPEDREYVVNAYLEAGESLLGRELSLGEKVAFGIPGLLSELWLTGKMFPQFGGGAAAPRLTKQVEKVVRRGKLKGVHVDAESITNILSKPTFPEQVAAAESYVENLAHAAKMDPGPVKELFRRAVGPQAKHMGKRMGRWFGMDVPWPMARKVPEEGLVPFGAGQTGGKVAQAARGVGSTFSWGKGTPRGAKEAMREAMSPALQGERFAERGKMIEESVRTLPSETRTTGGMPYLGAEEESRRFTRALDLAEFRTRQLREGAPEETFQRALRRAGMTAEDVNATLAKATPSQRKAYQQFRKDLDEQFKALRNEGVDVGYLEGMIPHIETKASLKKKPIEFGKPEPGKGTTKHARHRLPIAEGAPALGGTPTREFEQRLGAAYAKYMTASSISLANARAENTILRGYGKLITPEMLDRGGNILPHIAEQMKAQGLGRYPARIGKFKGQEFFVDKELGRFLEKTTQPGKISKFIESAEWYLNWWKARATVFRPGFMVRNVLFGNLYQQWLADVDIIGSNILAARGLMRLKAREIAKYAPDSKSWGRIRNKIASPGLKVGKYSMDEALDLARQHSVIDTGYFGGELRGGVTEGTWWNPWSRGFAPMRGVKAANVAGENNAKLGVFFDKLKKGFTPQEAAQVAARHIFNYNELTTFGKAARQVFPFWTWTSKMWGLGATTAMTKIGKFPLTARAHKGLQELDSLTPEEQALEPYKPEFMQGAFRAPGFRYKEGKLTFGQPEGSRAYTLTTTLVPSHSLLEVLEPRDIPQTLGNMLHPFLKGVIEQAGFAKTIFRRVPFQRAVEDRRLAPGWAKWFMGKMMEEDPELWKKFTGFFQPIYDPIEYAEHLAKFKGVERVDPELAKSIDPDKEPGGVVGYTWPSIVEYAIQTIDPGFATVNRVMKQNRDEDTYDALKATLLGLKFFEYGTKQASREYLRTQIEVEEKTRQIYQNWLKKHGKPPASFEDPNYTIFPRR